MSQEQGDGREYKLSRLALNHMRNSAKKTKLVLKNLMSEEIDDDELYSVLCETYAANHTIDHFLDSLEEKQPFEDETRLILTEKDMVDIGFLLGIVNRIQQHLRSAHNISVSLQ